MSRSRSENRSPDSKKSTPSHGDLLRLMNELREYIDEKGEIINENHWRDIVEIVGASMVGTSMDGEYVDIDFDAMDSGLFDRLETWRRNNPPPPRASQNRKRLRAIGADPMNPSNKPKSSKEDARYIYYLAETALAIAPTVLHGVIKNMYPDQDIRLKDTVTGTMNDFRKRMKDNPEELKNIYTSNGQNGDRFPDLFHPVFKDEIKEILENKGNDTSTTTSDSKKENENAFYNAKIERIWTLSGLPTHITKEEKLSVKLRDETRTALNIYDHDKIRRVLHDKSEKLLAWYKSSRKDLSDLKNRIDTEITSPVSWVHLEVANRDSGGDREIRTG